MFYRAGQFLEPPRRPFNGSLALLIGFEDDNVPTTGMPFSGSACERIPYPLLHAALAGAPEVAYVVAPLVGRGFDALDLASELALAGYRGTFLVMIPALPEPAIIRHEIAQLCPGLTVQLVPRARH